MAIHTTPIQVGVLEADEYAAIYIQVSVLEADEYAAIYNQAPLLGEGCVPCGVPIGK